MHSIPLWTRYKDTYLERKDKIREFLINTIVKQDFDIFWKSPVEHMNVTFDIIKLFFSQPSKDVVNSLCKTLQFVINLTLVYFTTYR